MRTTLRIIYSGRVQGVGFRFRARLLSEHHLIGGQVKNLPDGRVELVVQGEPEEIDRFRKSIRSEMGRLIHGEEEHDVENAPNYSNFNIAR
jgi:acylphosphatase